MANFGRRHYRAAEREIEQENKQAEFEKVTRIFDGLRLAANFFLLGLIVADIVVKYVAAGKMAEKNGAGK